jgi:hypothetical protein
VLLRWFEESLYCMLTGGTLTEVKTPVTSRRQRRLIGSGLHQGGQKARAAAVVEYGCFYRRPMGPVWRKHEAAARMFVVSKKFAITFQCDRGEVGVPAAPRATVIKGAIHNSIHSKALMVGQLNFTLTFRHRTRMRQPTLQRSRYRLIREAKSFTAGEILIRQR